MSKSIPYSEVESITARQSLSAPLFGVLFGVWWGIITEGMLNGDAVLDSRLFGLPYLPFSKLAIRVSYMVGSIMLFVVLSNLYQFWESELNKLEKLSPTLRPARVRGFFHGINYVFPIAAITLSVAFVASLVSESIKLPPTVLGYGPLILIGWLINDYFHSLTTAQKISRLRGTLAEEGSPWT